MVAITSPEEFANKLDRFENVRADKKTNETSWRDNPGECYSDIIRTEENVEKREFRLPPVKEGKYRAPREEQYGAMINTRKYCCICELSHLVRDCPERYQVSTQNKKERNQEKDVPIAEIQSYFLKPDKSSYLPVNIPTNVPQYVTTKGNKEVKTLVDSGAQIPVIKGKFLSQGKLTTGRIILTSAFGERIEAGLAKFRISMKSKFHRPIEILAAVSSRIQEQLTIPTNIYQLFKISTEDGGEWKTEILRPLVRRTKNELRTKLSSKRRVRRIKEGNREAERKPGKTKA
ncbi:hypothetical protein AVEN_185111-1 [Araneus ventricosus]|uniref:Uncharacterized protein n=1 Tax=Araneus ventricosus TaxID=182803 RepID=A0A4Y2MRY4_ARAVE|nr:hypothetical protein AVEN_185111-1 [Araneus ventricosus]